jgi:putative membrane protein insertion efficiency factor
MIGSGDGKGAEERKAVRGPVALVLIAAIRAYQLSLSFFLGRHCRHLPTCSDYAMEAVRRHGAYAGFWLGLFRVARCHPWGTHGFDPPPEEAPRRELRFWRYARFGRRR